jgi:hypothetical protein
MERLIFVLRLALHMLPGYLVTFPHKLVGRKTHVRVRVTVPKQNESLPPQHLYGTFTEILDATRRTT